MIQVVTSFFRASVKLSTMSMNQLEKSLISLVTVVPSMYFRNGHSSRVGNWARLSCCRER